MKPRGVRGVMGKKNGGARSLRRIFFEEFRHELSDVRLRIRRVEPHAPRPRMREAVLVFAVKLRRLDDALAILRAGGIEINAAEHNSRQFDVLGGRIPFGFSGICRLGVVRLALARLTHFDAPGLGIAQREVKFPLILQAHPPTVDGDTIRYAVSASHQSFPVCKDWTPGLVEPLPIPPEDKFPLLSELELDGLEKPGSVLRSAGMALGNFGNRNGF